MYKNPCEWSINIKSRSNFSLRVIYFILNSSAILKRNETCLKRNETRGGKLPLSGTVLVINTTNYKLLTSPKPPFNGERDCAVVPLFETGQKKKKTYFELADS